MIKYKIGHFTWDISIYLSIIEFIMLNPSGNVPVLVDGDTLVADSVCHPHGIV